MSSSRSEGVRYLRIALVATTTLAIATRIVSSVELNVTFIILMFFPAIYALVEAGFMLPLTLAFSSLYIEQEVVNVVMAVVISTLGLTLQYVVSRREFPKVVVACLVAFTPIYIVKPHSIICAVAIAASTALLALKATVDLGRAKVEVREVERLVHLGDYAKYKVSIESPVPIYYEVFEGDTVVHRGGPAREVNVVLEKAAEHVGQVSVAVVVYVEHFKGLAKLSHGPFNLTFNAIPRAAVMIKRAEHVLRKYAEYLTIPRVVRYEVSPSGVGGTPGVEAPGVGGRGLYGLGSLGASIGGSTTSIGVVPPSRREREERGEVAVEASQALTPHEITIWHRIATELMRSVRAYISRIKAKSLVGEYAGVREFEPGDSLKMIHWKKSLRRDDIEELFVKVFQSEESVEGGGGGVSVFFADLVCTSHVDLDVVLTALYAKLLRGVERGGALQEVHLFVKPPGSVVYYFSGKVVDVLAALNTLTLKGLVTPLYDYESWGRERRVVLGSSRGFIRELEEYYRALGLAIAELIKIRVGERKRVVLIHSKAHAYKYALVADTLRSLGFVVSTMKHQL
jgi:hypothetical protein